MKTFFFNFLLLLLFSLNTNAQNLIYKGNKQYQATETWNFKINGTAWAEDLEVTIGKNEENGIIMLQTGVTPNSYIGGNIYIFLSNGAKITCLDKKNRDNVDNKSIVIYDLTTNELEMLKEYYISRIRFTIQPSSHEGFNGNKTADNKISIFSLGGSDEKNHIGTDIEISELFNN
jgi:hypothetical protein